MKVKSRENYHYITKSGQNILFHQGNIYDAKILQYTIDPYEVIHNTGIAVECDNDTFNQYFSLVNE